MRGAIRPCVTPCDIHTQAGLTLSPGLRVIPKTPTAVTVPGALCVFQLRLKLFLTEMIKKAAPEQKVPTCGFILYANPWLQSDGALNCHPESLISALESSRLGTTSQCTVCVPRSQRLFCDHVSVESNLRLVTLRGSISTEFHRHGNSATLRYMCSHCAGPPICSQTPPLVTDHPSWLDPVPMLL